MDVRLCKVHAQAVKTFSETASEWLRLIPGSPQVLAALEQELYLQCRAWVGWGVGVKLGELVKRTIFLANVSCTAFLSNFYQCRRAIHSWFLPRAAKEFHIIWIFFQLLKILWWAGNLDPGVTQWQKLDAETLHCRVLFNPLHLVLIYAKSVHSANRCY